MKGKPTPRLALVPLAICLASFGTCAPDRTGSAPIRETAGQNRLWYRQPAADWNEALPVGNGRLGAMVFGHPGHERLQLNEETIWAGSPLDNNNPGALEHLPAIRQTLFAGEYGKASDLAEKYMLGTPPRIRSYQPLGDLLIDLEDVRAGSGYERGLDLRDGIASVVCETPEGVRIGREVFASAVDDVLVVRIMAGRGAAITGTIRLTRAKDARTKAVSPDTLDLVGQIIDAPDPLSGPGGVAHAVRRPARCADQRRPAPARRSALACRGRQLAHAPSGGRDGLRPGPSRLRSVPSSRR